MAQRPRRRTFPIRDVTTVVQAWVARKECHLPSANLHRQQHLIGGPAFVEFGWKTSLQRAWRASRQRPLFKQQQLAVRSVASSFIGWIPRAIALHCVLCSVEPGRRCSGLALSISQIPQGISSACCSFLDRGSPSSLETDSFP